MEQNSTLFNNSQNSALYNSGKPYISISQVLGLLQEPFDQKGVAQKTYDKNFNDPESKYYQMTVEQIMEAWSAKGAESCHYGNLLDDYIGLNLTKTSDELELWKLDNNYDYDSRLLEHCKGFDDFYKLLTASGDMVFVTREKTVYLDMGDFLIKGRFDALFYNKRTKKFVIIDWKSSGNIDKTPTKWTKKLFGPCGNFPALNYYTYTLQLYFYKKTLVQMGYLPEGTSLDDVTVMIVNLPDHFIEEANSHYQTHNAAFKYDDDLLNKTFTFAFKKHTLLNKNK